MDDRHDTYHTILMVVVVVILVVPVVILMVLVEVVHGLGLVLASKSPFHKILRNSKSRFLSELFAAFS
ncbi:hypothetical protein [Hymenobacter sublimis]|uniref:Transmembrane protein n=1 Tax=Hymenobacter sublimis TaxID=2933777 RepID=A0ABY4JGY1_9BACT|nr:hypothetical protein [Hymenobacter sublimis]UPL51077.1 hypothetical protein MWH26_09245 [Hymenobacter sublimis]